jgi:hypothetical protein
MDMDNIIFNKFKNVSEYLNYIFNILFLQIIPQILIKIEAINYFFFL